MYKDRAEKEWKEKKIYIYIYTHKQHGELMISTDASQQKCPGFESTICIIACSLCVCVGTLRYSSLGLGLLVILYMMYKTGLQN